MAKPQKYMFDLDFDHPTPAEPRATEAEVEPEAPEEPEPPPPPTFTEEELAIGEFVAGNLKSRAQVLVLVSNRALPGKN